METRIVILNDITFNRTSLELKRIPWQTSPMRWGWTFNRTSLELKHEETQPCCEGIRTLLIAPVWNWNISRWYLYRVPFLLLLIAPVWNWNVGPAGKLYIPVFKLLIAPVWNWNSCDAFTTICEALLLIAPVWNWNGHSLIKRVRVSWNF